MDFNSAEKDGRRFVFADSGDGPPVVLFHGFPDTPSGWEPAAKVLNDAGYRTIVPFLRGYHPETIVPGRGYGSQEIGEDAIALLDAVGLESAVLVGHDWGAAVVYRAAAIAPERVRGLCPVAIPHPRMIDRKPGLLWRARHFITLSLPSGRWLARRNDFSYIDTLMRRWAPSWSGPEREATLAEVKRCFADPVVLDAALGYYRDAKPGGEPGTLTMPAMLTCGTDDLIAPDAFKRSAEMFSGPCEVFVVDGAGHWPHREAASLFHERLLAFLASLP
ncbi:MAG TPA: alpha/beta hydrolase [Solirubrobacteraceae bacterium]|jgi:pimeloyl-ACP methyl ester carboxylesterase|nr:alpha/beta hydrolase [Solirubrobacteraceae bacterium]